MGSEMCIRDSGLTLAAISGQLVAEQASGLTPSVNLQPFLAGRFR